MVGEMFLYSSIKEKKLPYLLSVCLQAKLCFLDPCVDWLWVPISCYSINIVKVKQSHYRPGGSPRVPGIKVPRFHDNGTGWW